MSSEVLKSRPETPCAPHSPPGEARPEGPVLELLAWQVPAEPFPVLELPLDFPRRSGAPLPAETVAWTLSAERRDALEVLARRTGAEPSEVLLAAYVLFLQQVTNEGDVLVGVQSGQGVATWPGWVRLRFDAPPTPEEVLRQVQAQVRVPREDVGPSVSLPSETPRPAALFTLSRQPRMEWAGRASPCLPQGVDLVLEVPASGQGDLLLRCQGGLVRPETLSRFARQYDRVLEALLDGDERPLSARCLLTDEDQALYARFNDTGAPFPAHQTLPERFARSVARFGERLAVSDEHRAWTYRELDARANQVAHLLRRRGVRRGQLVGILLSRGVEVIASMFGILKAGCAFVPIDPDYPEDRVAYMLEDSGAPLLLSERALLPRFPALRHALLCVEDYPEDLPREPVALVGQPEDIAYVIYTSGSTGRPKGVRVPHPGVLNVAQWWADRYGLHAEDVMMQLASYSFDVSIAEIFPALLQGARLHIVSGAQRLSCHDFAEVVGRVGGTCGVFVPVFFGMLCTHLPEEQLAKLRSLRMLLLGGDVLPPQFVRLWRERVGAHTRLVNAYGPTETTCCSTEFAIDGPLAEEQRSIPIGRPLPNTEVFILNRWNQRCPVGTVGELCIASVGIAQGYLHQPEKTAEVFIPHPFGSERFGQVYRTGDLARLMPDGTLEYLGRKDQQVKVRGFRIELGEIEETFARHPAVREVAVVARHREGGASLSGFYTSHSGQPVPADALRAFLAERLPGHMVPSFLRHLPRMPLSPSGKLDRKGLPDDDAVGAAPPPDAGAAPVNALQRELLEAWKAALRVETLGLGEDVFRLGATSLLVMGVLARFKSRYPRLGAQDFFQHRTVEALARYLSAGLDAAPASRLGLERGPRRALNLSAEEVARLRFRAGPPSAVLLTGATGFLGAHLLHSLLRDTHAHVWCLVRPSGEHGGARRLEDTARFYFPEDAHLLEGRVTALEGDLERERLGLEAATWERLAGTLDAVLHCGAEVRYVGDVAHFRRVNVESTQRLLALARQGRSTRFHHISTLGLVGSHEADPEGHAFTEEAFDRGQELGSLYTESKFLAEQLVMDAAREGLPVTIYRIGNVTGHSATGRFQRNIEANAFYRVLKATLLLGSTARAEARVDLSPVDYCGRAVVRLASQANTVGRTLHICNPVQVPSSELVSWVRGLGYAVRELPAEEYRARLLAPPASPRYAEAQQLVLTQTDEARLAGSRARLACEATVALLEGSGIHCPPPSRDLLQRLVAHAVERGYFPAPGP
jgi:amino acid adenylation domain-containing protein/thioester reductase-like protein